MMMMMMSSYLLCSSMVKVDLSVAFGKAHTIPSPHFATVS